MGLLVFDSWTCWSPPSRRPRSTVHSLRPCPNSARPGPSATAARSPGLRRGLTSGSMSAASSPTPQDPTCSAMAPVLACLVTPVRLPDGGSAPAACPRSCSPARRTRRTRHPPGASAQSRSAYAEPPCTSPRSRRRPRTATRTARRPDRCCSYPARHPTTQPWRVWAARPRHPANGRNVSAGWDGNARSSSHLPWTRTHPTFPVRSTPPPVSAGSSGQQHASPPPTRRPHRPNGTPR